MPIYVNTGVRAEVMLIQKLQIGGGVVGVALRAGVKILPDWGMCLP